MRTLAALALVLAACGPSDRPEAPAAHDAPSATPSRGPDPIVLRIARDGGVVRAYAYPRFDSILWTSTSRAPAIEHVLAFDPEAGSLAYVDRAGMPGRIDFRLGSVGAATRVKLAALSSADGYAIYGIATGGDVTRLTPSGDWDFKTPGRARQLFPQSDGSLLVLVERGRAMTLLRVRPPEQRVSDSLDVPRAQRALRTQIGDRVYLVVDSGLVGVRNRDLSLVPRIRFAAPVRALSSTPSGDRIFVATEGSSELSVVDRYRDAVEKTIELPAPAIDLRIDPLGRYLLARPEKGDSAWVIAIGTDRLIGSVATEWRTDLPLVAPDGAIALTAGRDVLLVDGETLRERGRVADGATDFWHVLLWNGFRPRAAGLDEPVRFSDADSAAAAARADSAAAAVPADSVAPPSTATPPRPATSRPAAGRPPPADSSARPPSPSPARQAFTVSFAALLSEQKAKELAASISVDGQKARVVAGMNSGTPIFRVILGPYATKEDAERAGKDAGKPYWIYEGNP